MGKKNSKIKKIFKGVMLAIGVALLAGLVWLVCGVCWMYKFNKAQEDVIADIPSRFEATLPLHHDQDGRFLIEADYGRGKQLFALDTHARSMMRADSLTVCGAQKWGKYYRAVRNYYGQSFKYDIYTLPELQFGGLTLHNTLWSSIIPENRLYDLLDHNLIGTSILQLMCWGFDTKNDSLLISSIDNDAAIRRMTEGYVKYDDGMDREAVDVDFPDTKVSGKFIFDIGYGYYMSVNKEMFDRLKEKYPVKIETDSDKECYAMHDVKIRLAGCDTIIPIRYYPETNANLIGATLMSRFSFSIINTKELSTLYIRAN